MLAKPVGGDFKSVPSNQDLIFSVQMPPLRSFETHFFPEIPKYRPYRIAFCDPKSQQNVWCSVILEQAENFRP
jgi:hypothetical protein